jgi:hypothetical protein
MEPISRDVLDARLRGVTALAGETIPVIACDKREAFAQGSEATKQSMSRHAEEWIASLRSQ